MKRIITELKGCYRVKGARDTVETVVRNLSPTGVCFEAPADYAPQEQLELTVALNDEKSIHLTGVVIWAHNGQPLPEHCVGLKIIDMSPEDEMLLNQYYQRILSRSGDRRHSPRR